MREETSIARAVEMSYAQWMRDRKKIYATVLRWAVICAVWVRQPLIIQQLQLAAAGIVRGRPCTPCQHNFLQSRRLPTPSQLHHRHCHRRRPFLRGWAVEKLLCLPQPGPQVRAVIGCIPVGILSPHPVHAHYLPNQRTEASQNVRRNHHHQYQIISVGLNWQC